MKNNLKKIISGMIAASIMTAAIFSASANLTTDGNYNGTYYYGELQINGSNSNTYAKGTTSRSGGNGFTGVSVYSTGRMSEGSDRRYTDYKESSAGGSYAEVYLRSSDVDGGIGEFWGTVGQHYITSKSESSSYTTHGNPYYIEELFDYYKL